MRLFEANTSGPLGGRSPAFLIFRAGNPASASGGQQLLALLIIRQRGRVASGFRRFAGHGLLQRPVSTNPARETTGYTLSERVTFLIPRRRRVTRQVILGRPDLAWVNPRKSWARTRPC